MKLTPITTHSDYLNSLSISDSDKWRMHLKRNDFGKQELKLGMFFPCDEYDIPLDEPINYKNWFKGMVLTCDMDSTIWYGECERYSQAKERVLFEGGRFEVDMYKQTKRTIYYVGNIRIALLLEFHSGESQFKFELTHSLKTVEDLSKYPLDLTQSAINQLELWK